jgi:hypothetical protein
LLDLADLRSVLSYLISDDGKAELTGLGGLSSATVGVILRELITFADQGADAFFGVVAGIFGTRRRRGAVRRWSSTSGGRVRPVVE